MSGEGKDENISIGMAVASLCIEMIADDPDLITRLQAHAATRSAPFDQENLNEDVLRLADRLVTLQGLRAARRAKSQPDVRVEHMLVPVPRDKELAEQSAGVLALASYAAEFLRKHPEHLAAFQAWWDEGHPEGKGVITPERLNTADEMLIAMAAVASSVADRQEQPTEDANGIRHV